MEFLLQLSPPVPLCHQSHVKTTERTGRSGNGDITANLSATCFGKRSIVRLGSVCVQKTESNPEQRGERKRKMGRAGLASCPDCKREWGSQGEQWTTGDGKLVGGILGRTRA